MALLEANFVSKSLFRTVTFTAILPVDKFFSQESGAGQAPFKTLYLLHGLLGNHTDWVTGTRIQRWAEERNLAVIMPSGENAFYVDEPESGKLYGEFIGRELVDITRRMFPLSRRRENTFIGGLSMGGYGAIRNGLKYSDTFSRIIGLSSAVHLLESRPEETKTIAFEASCFKPFEEAVKSDKNPRVLIDNIVSSGAEKPKIFMACGTEDSLIGANRVYRDLFIDKGFDVTYMEEPGRHDWDFWDRHILRALDWLPLDAAKGGVNSGNVEA